MKQRGKKGFIVVAVVACCVLWGLCAQGEAASTITDAEWVSMNPGIPGVGGNIYAMAVDASGNLYAAGSFKVAGTVLANNIAKWDGTSWSALGSGVDRTVFALAFDASGNLYAGGWGTIVGGVMVNTIAKWDGTSWSALGPGIDGPVYALAFDTSGNLYAGGGFTTAGGVTANYIAKWDGASWSALGSGMSGGNSYDHVKALAVDATGALYAGGDFTSAGGVTVNHIAKWDGTSWSALGSGVDDDFGYVSAFAFDPSGSLYVGGGFTIAGGVTVNNVAKWDGSSWSALGSGMGGDGSPVLALAVGASGTLYAGGGFTIVGGVPANHIARWDGSSWSALGSGVEGLEDFCVGALALDASGNLYTGGEFITAGGATVNNVAKWNGSSWSALGPKMGVLYPKGRVAALAPDASGNLYAGGSFAIIGGVTVNNIAKWNGTSWSALGTGIDGTVYALAVDASGTLYAGGVFTTAGGSTVNNIAKWDGSAWSALGSGIDGTVGALAVDTSGTLYAGGSFTTAGSVTVNSIAKWDGSTWSALGSGMEGGVSFLGPWRPVVRTLAFAESGTLYAGGEFTKAGGITAYGVAQWNGRAWSALGLGLTKGFFLELFYYVIFPPFVHRLVFDPPGNLYAVGNFATDGPVKAVNVAKWNGFSWSAVDAMKNLSAVPIDDLAFDSAGNMYAGGSFTTANNGPADNIAKWDGATWSALGSGLDSFVSRLAVDASDNLYAGGSFTIAGGKVSPYIAKCKLPEQTSTTTTTIGCPATQVLGSDNPNLESLRDFRDSKLAHSFWGLKTIQIYYNNAAGINAALERSPGLQLFARRALEVIAPMVGRKED